MAGLRRILPGATLIGHRALLAEGVGDSEGRAQDLFRRATGFHPGPTRMKLQRPAISPR